MKIAVRIIPDGNEIRYVRYVPDQRLKLLRISQEWLQSFCKAGLRKNYGIYCIYNIDLEVTVMLKTPELAMPRTNKVTTVYNGKREVWTDYEEAKAYFLEIMMTAEGEERERAECVYIQLLHGLDECSDENE